jgi:outer membrane protein assembly factor BamB
VSGAILWKNSDLHLDHKEGPGSSPIIWGNDFILHCDGTDVQYVAVLNKFNGRIAFEIQRSYPLKTLNFDLRKAYSTPTVASIDGKEQLISLGSRRVYGYDPVDGKELWHCDIPGFSNVPRPVIGDGIVFISTGFANAELWAIKPQAAGADGVAPIVWKWTRGCPLKPSVLFVNDQVYFVSDSGIGRCLDAKTGQQLWQSRILAACTASPVYAGGYIYFFDEHGKCAVLRPGPTLDEVSENQLDGRILASPAVVGDAMFVRTDAALYRIEKGETRMTKPESPNQ